MNIVRMKWLLFMKEVDLLSGASRNTEHLNPAWFPCIYDSQFIQIMFSNALWCKGFSRYRAMNLIVESDWNELNVLQVGTPATIS